VTFLQSDTIYGMSIYHLHIPRTSGGFVRKIMTDSDKFQNKVVGHYRAISENDFKKADLISGHYGIGPAEVVDKTFTVVRDPNELTFSYIKYLSMIPGGEKFCDDHVKRYLHEEKLRASVTNVLSKFFSLRVDLDKYNSNIHDHMNMANNSWYLEDKKFSADTAIESIKKNNISVFLYESPNLYNNIITLLGIKLDGAFPDRVNQSFKDPSGLYEKYLDDISKANGEDLQLYNRILRQ